MKTKTVDIYTTLFPGWQDSPIPCIFASSGPPQYEFTPGGRLVRITVELPCFGGSADVTDEVKGIAKEEPK